MKRVRARQFLSACFSMVLAASLAFPALAFAAQPDVEVENHTATGAQAITGIRIDGVDAPTPGEPLDDRATVTTAEDVTWDIPVLWIDNNVQLATEAVEDHRYLPVLAFFVPQEYSVEGASFTVELSDSLSKLFGDEPPISIFDSRTGITYILPFSLRDFFTPSVSTANQGGSAAEDVSAPQEAAPAATNPETAMGLGDADSLIDIFCAKTARDVLTDDDLEYLIDLVLNKLEPQAVNLLLESFPAFKAGASENQIGKEIGLYIYYEKGDKDGKPEHEGATSALAYVSGDVVKKDGQLKYCYMVGIDVDDLLLKDKDDNPITNENTKKFILDRDGEGSATFNNTIVHELFHAIEDDYNRTGILGAKSVYDGYTPNNQFVSEAQYKTYYALRYPQWFIEGTASAVENVYQYRHDMFKKFRASEDDEDVYEDTYTKSSLLNNYLNATDGGKPLNFRLEYAAEDSEKVNTTPSRYVTGYLAALYLGQLAAQKNESIGSAMNKDGSFTSWEIRMGLDSIYKRMHNGETLDQVIKDISSIDGEPSLYNDTDDFEKKFIMGLPDEEDTYYGDTASLEFTVSFLNYMLSLENTSGRRFLPNGSILYNFDDDFNIPLDETKEYKSDFLVIVNSNEFVPSTVQDSIAFVSGGKSDPTQLSAAADEATAEEAELPLAAKAAAEPVPAEEPATEPESSPTEEATPEAAAAPAEEPAAVPESYGVESTAEPTVEVSEAEAEACTDTQQADEAA